MSSSSNSSRAASPVFVEESSIDIYKVGQNFSVPPDQTADWVINVTLALRSAKTFRSPSLTLEISELNLKSDSLDLVSIQETTTDVSWVHALWHVPDDVPERWYPHNLGTPKLYNLTVNLHLTSKSDVDTSFTVTTGFRTIQLVQSPYSREDVARRGITPGDQWHFDINGKTFYSKGTNIIPFDPFYARIKTDDVRWILESAVKSGQNMVSFAVLWFQ